MPNKMVGLVTTIVWLTFLVAGFSDLSDAARNEFVIPPNTGCACVGRVLTYTCTVIGTGNTLWAGTAFQCPANGIILRHERFTESGGAVGECNSGAIQGRSIGVENSCYTSQLEVTVSATLSNKTVQCVHNSGVGIDTIGTSVVTVIEAPYPPPNNVRLSDIDQETLTFSWDSLGPRCTSVIYGISSTCGSCGPTSTNATIVGCSNFQLSSNVSTCNFSVNSVFYGDTGPSSTVIVTLKVPDIPRATITPFYSANQTLIKTIFMLNQEASFNIADGISGAVLSYDTRFNSGLSVTNTACDDDNCEFVVDLPSFICNSSVVINTTVSATNRLGEGPSSDPTPIECTNRFVEIEHNSATSTISCIFLNELDTSEKVCSIQYGVCDQEFEVTETVSDTTTSDTVMLKIALTVSDRTYCYNITARNRTYTVMVGGRIDTILLGSPSLVGIVVPVIFSVILMIALGIAILMFLIFLTKRHIYKLIDNGPNLNINVIERRFSDDDLPHLKLKAVDQNEWFIAKYDVDSDCSLKEFVEKHNLIFKRGRVFYEFNNEVERISRDKQLILMNKETQKYFNPDASPEELCEKELMGERVLQPCLSKYQVFVQSTGLGARHVAAGSGLLYVKQRPQPLWTVDETQFKVVQTDKACTLETFCVEHQLDFTKCSLYIERDDFRMEQKIHDVILMDKDTEKFLTGPYAHRMTKEGAEDVVKQQWRVFICSVYEKEFRLKKNRKVLYKLQEEHKQKQQRKQQLHSYADAKKPPLIRINSEQFTSRKLESNYNLSEFCNLSSDNLDPNEMNVFVEIGRINVEQQSILDVILMDKDTKEFYTGPSSWNETRNYTSGGKNTESKKFMAFLLCKFEKNPLLLKNSWVLYRVNKKQWQADGIVPICSKRFMNLTVEKGSKVGDFYERQKLGSEEHTYMFIERTHFHQDEHIYDVILMDKLSSQLFTYPCAYLRVHKHLTDDEGGIRKEVQERWRVFVLSKPNKGFVFEEDTSVLCQDSKYLEQFHVLKVDQNNIRMSDFVKKKIGTFENGKIFYEFKQDEDLPCYKEVVHVPSDVYTNRMRSAVDKKVRCACSSSIESFYKIPGVPGFEIKPPPSSNFKVFVQSTSQGSRCLKTGMVLLYKKRQISGPFN